MATVAESANAPHQLASGLQLGVDTLSENQTIKFTKYVKLILPLDGYVFWVNAGIVSASALYNASQYNATYLNQPESVTPPSDAEISVSGSLHYATESHQDEDATMGVNYMIFTAKEEIQDFNAISPVVMYIAEIDGIKFAFNDRQSFYKQSGLWHYRGHAVYSTMETQLVDSLDGFDTENVIVSNSLPIWLSLNAIIPMYPSFLSLTNLTPPYATVHIAPESTEALQAVPRLDITGSHYQLVSEVAKITLYGLRNFNALDFQDYIFERSLFTDTFGVMDTPVIRDEKKTQSELSVLAMKKSFTVKISYYQQTARNIARQLIKSAFITYE